MLTNKIAIAAIAAFLCAHEAAAQNTRFTLATGVQYSDGEYGETTSTRAIVVPLFARVSRGGWSFQASVPYVELSGPASVGDFLDDDGSLGSHGGGSNSGSGSSGSGDDTPDDVGNEPPPPPPVSPDRLARGFGDTTLTLGYSLPGLEDTPLYVELRGRVRLPSGSRRDGLGTGATDYALLTEVGVEGRRGGAYLSAGRRFLGAVSGVERNDGWQAGAGAWWNASRHFMVGLNYDRRDSPARAGLAAQFAEAWVAWRPDNVWRLEINGGAGLSASAADVAVGFTLSWRSVRRRN